jgi:hypothetical protein
LLPYYPRYYINIKKIKILILFKISQKPSLVVRIKIFWVHAPNVIQIMDSSKKTRQIDVGNARTIVICIPTIFVRVRDGFRHCLIPLMLRLDANKI